MSRLYTHGARNGIPFPYGGAFFWNMLPPKSVDLLFSPFLRASETRVCALHLGNPRPNQAHHWRPPHPTKFDEVGS